MARLALQPAPRVPLRALAALPIVLAAAAVRILLVGPLGRSIPYLTFYPAVMLASLWGGFPAGFLATLASSLLAFYWIEQGRTTFPESMALWIFVVSSLGLAVLVESRRRHAALARQALADLHEDIARRERAEAEARRTNALLRESQAVAGVGGWEVDLVAGTLFWTEEIYRILETSAEECPLDLETPYGFCTPESVPVIAEAMRRAYEDGLGFDLELELVTARQRRLWARVTGRPIQEDGRTLKVTGALQDITEWKRMADAKHKAIFVHSPLGICWTDPEGLIREVNPAYVAMLGYEAAELLGTPIGRFARMESEEAETGMRETADQARAGTRWMRKDGRAIWVNLTVRSVLDAAGQVQFYFATVEDITAMRQAQDDLKRLLREQEIVLGSAKVGISLVIDRKQVWVNRWMCEMLQYSREELEGRDTRHLYRSPEAREKLAEEAFPALARGENVSTVQELVRKDGQSRWIHYNGTAIDPADIAKGTLWVLTDVTDQKRMEEALLASEQKYSTLFRILPTGVVLVDEGGRTVDANPAALRILGVSRAELLSRTHDTPAWRIIRPDGTLCPPEEFVTVVAMREGRAVENVELGTLRRDGSIVWTLVSATPIPVKGFGVAWVALDITQRRQAEAALAELNRELEDRVRTSVAELRRKDQMLITQNRHAAMGEMIGNIAHQWRQPLNALSMLLINLGDAHQFGELDGAKLQRALGKGDLLIQKMSSTINDFMTFFQQGKALTAFSALAQVHAAVALVEASFEDMDIAIRIDAPEDVLLSGFPNEYSQVLLNLLSNAKEAIRDAGRAPGRVSIRLAREAGFGKLTLRDDGAGIAEALLDRIFEPYFSTRASGTGIGLYMSRQIIEAHMGGSLSARNIQGGSEFTVLVPLAGEDP